jgi:hypothetical protein
MSNVSPPFLFLCPPVSPARGWGKGEEDRNYSISFSIPFFFIFFFSFLFFFFFTWMSMKDDWRDESNAWKRLNRIDFGSVGPSALCRSERRVGVWGRGGEEEEEKRRTARLALSSPVTVIDLCVCVCSNSISFQRRNDIDGRHLFLIPRYHHRWAFLLLSHSLCLGPIGLLLLLLS